MPSNHPIHCHPLLLLPSIFPSIRGFSNESVKHYPPIRKKEIIRRLLGFPPRLHQFGGTERPGPSNRFGSFEGQPVGLSAPSDSVLAPLPPEGEMLWVLGALGGAPCMPITLPFLPASWECRMCWQPENAGWAGALGLLCRCPRLQRRKPGHVKVPCAGSCSYQRPAWDLGLGACQAEEQAQRSLGSLACGGFPLADAASEPETAPADVPCSWEQTDLLLLLL